MATEIQKTTYTAAEVAALERRISEQQAEIETLKKKLEQMNAVFLNTQHARRGQNGEKNRCAAGQDRLTLFNEAESEQDPKAAEPTEETFTVAAHTRKKKKTLDEKLAELPVKEILLELPEDRRICRKCGGTLRMIGKKFVRREMIMIPRSVKLLEYYTCGYACDCCDKGTGTTTVFSTQAPPPLMKHSLASPSTVADVMTKKYVDGLSLARQEKAWARQGVELSRATLANWIIQTEKRWLKPLWTHMKQQIRDEHVIHADETVVQVLNDPDQPTESRMWVYVSGGYSRKPVRIFEYQPDRKGDRAKAFLRGFSGCLVTDGDAGYNHVENVIHCGCWSHMQRKWLEAVPDGADLETSKAAVGYQYCNKLFARERICKQNNPTPKGRKEYRQNIILPILEEYFFWLETVHPEKDSKLSDAVAYARNQKDALMAFIEYGDVPISNTLAETAIHPFTQGQKGWLFCDGMKGAEASAVVYTLVETATANGIDPYDYLLLVLTMLPYLGKNPSHEELEKLMPWHPAVKNRERIRNK